MKLLFDLYGTQAIGRLKYNGGSEYVRKIFIETVNNSDESVEICCTYNSEYPLDDFLRDFCLENNITLLDIARTDINIYIRQEKIDTVFLGIIQRHQNIEITDNVKLVMVCHDIRDLEVFPSRKDLWNFSDISTHKNSLKLYLKLILFKLFLKLRGQRSQKIYHNMLRLAKRANTLIITDSKHSKYMMLSHFPGLQKEKVRVLWAPELGYAGGKTACHELAGQKFWLIVSADRWEKNALPVIEALARINSSQTVKTKLVLVGNFHNLKVFKKIQEYGWLVIYDYLERSKLEWLYENCSALIYPSFAEGFGYPPIEAMRYNRPVVASATSSIMEVCGDAPIYLCPYNKSEIESRLRELLDTDPEHLSIRSNNRYLQIIERQHRDLKAIINIIIGEIVS